jgi:8-oxo-dGTP pyrophosphatase MutT (NUDIX family)
METKTDISYGVVPVSKKADGTWQVLVVHQISYRGDDFWIFPKGHAEGNENPKETALRELEEETGIKNITLEPSTSFSIYYAFKHEDVKIDKTVKYYLGYCADTKTIITQPQEIKELRWCDFKTAQQLLTHQNSKDILQQVQMVLR